jgi:Integrase core domain.
MLIPKPLRKAVLEGPHAAHQGINGMLANARTRFFWPGLDAAIRMTRAQCLQCNEQAPSQPKEDPIITPPPEVPFEQAAMDLCHLAGHQYLIYADRYSGWVEVKKVNNSTIHEIRRALLGWFTSYGVPREIATDGGPPFNLGEYSRLLNDWDIVQRLSSAYYAQSNGRAEAAVKSAKRILHGNTNPTVRLDTYRATKALLNHRNTPTQGTGMSPAAVLFGSPIRDHLPPHATRKEWQMIADSREIALAKRHIMPNVNQLEPLRSGDAVQIQNQHGNHPTKWHNTGIIAEALPHR